jgi:hypothetical protein
MTSLDLYALKDSNNFHIRSEVLTLQVTFVVCCSLRSTLDKMTTKKGIVAFTETIRHGLTQ